MSNRLVESSACLYTMTPDTDFIVDRLPESPHVAIGAGFSRDELKFATAIGERLVALALDPTATPLTRLALSRFSALV